MTKYLALIEFHPNKDITGKLDEAMRSNGFVQSPLSDVVYLIESNRNDDAVMDLVLQTLRGVGLSNVRVIVAKVSSIANS